MRKNFGAKPFLYPQPVMILGTYDENGKANAMNAAWGGIVGANEIIVDLSAHKTTDNIIKNKAFTVGVADLEHLVACDYVGIVSANKEPNKVKKAGFTTPDTSEALVKNKAMEQCKECYVLVDQSKFDKISPVTFQQFGRATIITERKPEGYMECENIIAVREN